MTSAFTHSTGDLGSVLAFFWRVGPMLLTTLSCALGRRLKQATTYSGIPSNSHVATVIFLFNTRLMFNLRLGTAGAVPPRGLFVICALSFLLAWVRNAEVKRNSSKLWRRNSVCPAPVWFLWHTRSLCFVSFLWCECEWTCLELSD